MSRILEISLTDKKIAQLWGADSQLSFTDNSAIIHLESTADSETNLEIIQQSARSLAKMKVSSVSLVGNWSIEAQWFFWQGAYDPKGTLEINFASLTADLANSYKTESAFTLGSNN